jgi:hypothetical protein
MTHVQYLNSQLRALYELRWGIGTGKLVAASGKARQQAALGGLQKPPKNDTLFLSALMRPTSRWRISEKILARKLQYKATPQQLQNIRAHLSDDGGALVLFWQSMRSRFLQLYAVSSPSPSQSHSERKFSGARKTLSGEQDAAREAQLPLVAAGGGIYIRSFLLGHRKMEAANARARGVIGPSLVVVGSGYRVVVRGCDKRFKAI